MELFKLKNLCFFSNGRAVLHQITLDIHEGELLTIVGPNGGGKSTLIKILLGQVKADSGEFWRKKNLKMSYVPQNFFAPLDMPITVKRFLKGLDFAKKNSPLELLGIEKLLNQPLQVLSGGEMQKLLLARAMLNNPDFIALDEPAAGIDPAALGNYYQIIRNYQLENKTAIVMVSHDLHIVMSASDRVICLNSHICCDGLPQEVAGHSDYLALLGTQNPDAIGIYTHHHNHIHS